MLSDYINEQPGKVKYKTKLVLDPEPWGSKVIHLIYFPQYHPYILSRFGGPEYCWTNDWSPSEFYCEESKVKCLEGLQCIPKWSKCDGIQDCSDGSDEIEAICKGLVPTLSLTIYTWTFNLSVKVYR